MPERVRIPPSTIGPLQNGHPWVFRDVRITSSPGEIVELCDAKDRVVAWGLADEGDIAVRVLGRGGVPAEGLHRVVTDRIVRADRARFRLVPPDTDCWRVINGEGDGLPGLIVDRYGALAVLKIYAKAWERHLEGIVGAIGRLGWVTTVLRRFGVARVDDRDGAETLAGPAAPETVLVSECGMRLLARPFAGQKTGLFLDQREHRALVRRWASGRLVANLFGYNGGFSVAAALGGAARVTTVDIAPDAIADAVEVFRLNGLDPSAHAFEVADAFTWRPKEPVDLLIVDPPALARGKRSDPSALRAYRKLHAHLAPFVPRDGLLATSSCTARLGLDAWRDAVREGLSGSGDWSWHWISGEPPDHPTALGHPEGRYLKFALLRRR